LCEEALVPALRLVVVTLDEPDNARRGSFGTRQLRAATRVIEIASECGISVREAGAHARRKSRKQHRGDAVPEARARGLGAIVEQTGDDELVIGAHRAQDARGLVRVAVVRPDWPEVAHGLLKPVEHQLPVR
jgi:hypothetical protein